MFFLTGDAARDPAALAAAMLNLERGAVVFEPVPPEDDDGMTSPGDADSPGDAASLDGMTAAGDAAAASLDVSAAAEAAAFPVLAAAAVEAGNRSRNGPYACLRTKTVYYPDGRPALRLVPRRRLAACAVELGNGSEVRFRPRSLHLVFVGAVNGVLVGLAAALASAADWLDPLSLVSAASPTGIVWSVEQKRLPTMVVAPANYPTPEQFDASKRLLTAVAAATGAEVGVVRLGARMSHTRAALFERGSPLAARALGAGRDAQGGRIIFGFCNYSWDESTAHRAAAVWRVDSAGALVEHWRRAGRPLRTAECEELVDLATGCIVVQATPSLAPFDTARLVRREDVLSRRPPAWTRALAIVADGRATRSFLGLPAEAVFAPAAAGEPAAALIESAARYAARYSVAWIGGASPGAALVNAGLREFKLRTLEERRVFRRDAPDPLPAACAVCGDPLAGVAFEFCARLAPETADCVQPTPRDAFATFADEYVGFCPRVGEVASRPTLRAIAESLLDVPDDTAALGDMDVKRLFNHHLRLREEGMAASRRRTWHDGVATTCWGCYFKLVENDLEVDLGDLEELELARKALRFGGPRIFDHPAAVRAAPRAPAARGLEAFGAVLARAEPVYAAGGLPQVAGADDAPPALAALLVRGVPGGPVALAAARLGDCPELACAELAALAAGGCAIVPGIDLLDLGDLCPLGELRGLRDLRPRGELRGLRDLLTRHDIESSMTVAIKRIVSIALSDD